MINTLEELFEKFEYIITLKEKNIKKWDEIFPTFCSLSNDAIKSFKNKKLLYDLRKILEFVKPFDILPDERRNKRLKNLKIKLVSLKKEYLLDKEDFNIENSYNPFTDLKFLKHIGTKRANIFSSLNINNIYQLVYNYIPRDYEDRRYIKNIFNCKNDDICVIIGKIISFDKVSINKGLTIFNFSVEDSTGMIIVSFFNQKYVTTYLKEGVLVAFYGKVSIDYGRKQMKSPEFTVLEKTQDYKRQIIPIYPLTNGLYQKSIRKIFVSIFDQGIQLNEFLPEKYIEKYDLLNITQRTKGIHFPKSNYQLKSALYSMKIEELLLFETSIAMQKYFIKKNFDKSKKRFSEKLAKSYIETLNFSLTDDQINSWKEISLDQSCNYAMNRLLQGDVGSGKTVVSELAMLNNHEAGFQSAFMVPTSVLAKQQFLNIKKHFEKFNLNISILLGETKDSEKKKIKKLLKDGKIDIIIGTHALIQKDVEFKNLGLIIIDEQHRFGVEQRLKLINKSKSPDILVMSATPIPRTMALTLYGDLDISSIHQMPKGRKKVKTVLSTSKNEKNIYSFIEEELKKNNQAFFIYPLIEESEVMDLKAAEDMYKYLSSYYKNYKVGLLHGKLSSKEKSQIMNDFKEKKINVLVSTTVIEVGIDIEDATVIVIENADRFGLSQLHQLRGRVGRSKKQSFCFLITNNNTNSETIKKLNEFSSTSDGFKVSEMDLIWRGPGKFFGMQQHGLPDFKFVDLKNDLEYIKTTKQDIENDIFKNKNITSLKPIYAEAKKRFGNTINFIKAI